MAESGSGESFGLLSLLRSRRGGASRFKAPFSAVVAIALLGCPIMRAANTSDAYILGVTNYSPVTVTNSQTPTSVMAEDAQGNLWAGVGTAALTKTNPATGATQTFSIPNGVIPQGVTLGPDGQLWFTGGGCGTSGTGPMVQVMSTSGTITNQFTVPGTNGGVACPRAIILGSDGNLWFIDSTGYQDPVQYYYSDYYIWRMTPQGVFTQYEISPIPESAAGLTNGPNGNVWFTAMSPYSEGSSNYIGYVDVTKATTVSYSVQAPCSGAIGAVAYIPGGDLWAVIGNSCVADISTAGAVLNTYSTSGSYTYSSIVPGVDSVIWTDVGNGFLRFPSSAGASFTFLATSFPNTSGLTNFGGKLITGSDAAFWGNSTYCNADVSASCSDIFQRAALGTSTVNGVLPAGTIGVPYSPGASGLTLVDAAGGPFAIYGNSPLPQGLTLNQTTGAITGTPTGSAGTYTFQVQDTSNTTAVYVSGFSLTLAPGSQTITFNTIPTQIAGTTLSLTATASSGLAVSYSSSTPSVCSVSGSTASFVGAGNCTLTASQPGNSSYSAATPVSQTFSVDAQLAIVSTSPLSSGTIKTSYSVTLMSQGGSGNPIWSLAAGALPAGLNLNGSNISGTPTAVGTSTFTIQLADNAFPGVVVTKQFSLTIAAGAPAAITVTSGNNQTAAVDTAFGSPLTVSVTDAYGDPVPNVNVTFTAPASGASATFGTAPSATVLTNSAGMASAPSLTANSTAGSYAVTATVAGVANPASFALTNNTGAPGAITVASGSGQSTQVNTAFGAPLVVNVKDNYGNPVANATVTFTSAASSTGAGALFGSAASTTAQTNTAGVATSPTPKANGVAGSYTVTAGVSGVTTTASFALANTAGPASAAIATSGAGQSTQVNTAFAAPLVVTVKDSGGNPVPNVNVTFTAPASSGASASALFGTAPSATVQTNASGTATSPTLTANGVAGTYSVTATAAGVTTPATFALTNTAGTPSVVTAVSGGNQTAPVNTTFAAPLVVTVKDSGGNPVANVNVTFTAPASGPSALFGTAASVTVQTNATGIATSPAPKANGTAGTYSVTASAPGVTTPVSFALTNTAGAASAITAVSGSNQTAQVNTAFAAPLVVTVKDSGGNPVANVNVTFTSAPASSGASALFGTAASTTVQTNSSGTATSPTLTANAVAGTYSVSATAAGVTTPVTFALTNTAGAPSVITAVSGGNQTASVNTAFATPLVVTVKDSSGNPVANVNVTFTASAATSGASALFGTAASTTVQTNASGTATSPTLTANAIAGTYSVTATAAGVTTPVTFALTNTAGAPSVITAVSGGNQSAPVNTTFAAPLVVTVKDSGGNPVANVNVTFTAPASSASALFGTAASVTVQTNSTGTATSPAPKANGTAGTYSVTASAPGVTTPVSFALTNTAGAASAITAVSGSNQTAQVNTAFAAPLVVTVKDSGGNPVANANVTFTASAATSGASALFGTAASTTVQTNASGTATSPTLTANGLAGSYSVTATAAGVTTPVTFALTNTAGAASVITVVSGGNQSAPVNTTFAAAARSDRKGQRRQPSGQR